MKNKKNYNEYGWEKSKFKEILNNVNKSNYIHHYWAIVNGYITQKENAVLAKLVGDLYRGDEFPKSVITNDYMFEVENKIIFSDGKYNTFSINKIIEIIDAEDIESIKEKIYYAEQNNNFYRENEDLFKTHSRDGMPFDVWKQRNTSASRQDN